MLVIKDCFQFEKRHRAAENPDRPKSKIMANSFILLVLETDLEGKAAGGED